MRNIVLAVLATAGLIVGALAWPHPAEAASNPACMTRAEFGRIHHGQTQDRVRAIVGAPGKVVMVDSSPGYRFVGRNFRVCGSPYGLASVSFATTERKDGVPGVYSKEFWA